ncbi:hypothetical protein DFH08DRAFT_1041035 [Mycena albidolilacea]|uniref:Uncharacterized protein n=1 Tax=Mycena albidolilacea TaxID=1033008 RepID=A0AAD6ZAU6_9AGAR|nr:hypothetical protein DFH08DRAFT_1041035 [Mycena albidolilacea]
MTVDPTKPASPAALQWSYNYNTLCFLPAVHETRISDFYLSGIKAQSKTIVRPFSTQGVISWPPRLLVRRFPVLAAATLGLVMSDPQPKPPHPALIIPRIPKKSVHYGSASQEYIASFSTYGALSKPLNAVILHITPGSLKGHCDVRGSTSKAPFPSESALSQDDRQDTSPTLMFGQRNPDNPDPQPDRVSEIPRLSTPGVGRGESQIPPVIPSPPHPAESPHGPGRGAILPAFQGQHPSKRFKLKVERVKDPKVEELGRGLPPLMVQVGHWEVAAGGNASVYKGTLRLKNGAKKLVAMKVLRSGDDVEQEKRITVDHSKIDGRRAITMYTAPVRS